MTLDNYTQVYDASEASEVSTDLLVGILDQFYDFVTLIALIVLAGWAMKKTKGMKV